MTDTSNDDAEQLKAVFSLFDSEGTGFIDEDVIGSVLNMLEINITDEELYEAKKKIKIELSNIGKFDFGEFLTLLGWIFNPDADSTPELAFSISPPSSSISILSHENTKHSEKEFSIEDDIAEIEEKNINSIDIDEKDISFDEETDFVDYLDNKLEETSFAPTSSEDLNQLSIKNEVNTSHEKDISSQVNQVTNENSKELEDKIIIEESSSNNGIEESSKEKTESIDNTNNLEIVVKDFSEQLTSVHQDQDQDQDDGGEIDFEEFEIDESKDSILPVESIIGTISGIDLSEFSDLKTMELEDDGQEEVKEADIGEFMNSNDEKAVINKQVLVNERNRNNNKNKFKKEEISKIERRMRDLNRNDGNDYNNDFSSNNTLWMIRKKKWIEFILRCISCFICPCLFVCSFIIIHIVMSKFGNCIIYIFYSDKKSSEKKKSRKDYQRI